MPIPKEFDCNEVRMTDEEIDQFEKAIHSIEQLVEDNKRYKPDYSTLDHTDRTDEERKAYKKSEEAKADRLGEKFWQNHREDCKNGIIALNNLPESRDPKSMLQWIKQFPYLFTRDKLDSFLDNSRIGYGELFSDNGPLKSDDYYTLFDHYNLAKTWFSVFSKKEYRDKMFGKSPLGSRYMDYHFTNAEAAINKFREEAEKLGVPAKSEEELKETDFTGVFDEVKDTAVNKEDSAPKAEAEEEKENWQYPVGKRVRVKEDTTVFAKKVKDFKQQIQGIQDEIKETAGDYGTAVDPEKGTTRLFDKVYGETIKRELAAMAAGPKEYNPDGALEWFRSFPHVLAAHDLSVRALHGYEIPKEQFELAKEWSVYFKNDTAIRHNFDSRNVDTRHPTAFDTIKANLYDKGWKCFNKIEKTKIDSLVEKLENAKTFTNSDEYKQIISIAKMLNHSDELPEKFKGQVTANTPAARHAFKLASIKAQIDAYIDHKAKDGVKPNVYHKLAAVEELNRYVCEELNRIGVKNIPNGSPEVSVVNGKVPTSLEEESGAQTLNSYHVVPRFDVEEKECRCTLDCMSRIMLRADAMNLGEETMHKLDQLATAFQKGPNVDLEALQKQQEAPKTGLLEELDDGPILT